MTYFPDFSQYSYSNRSPSESWDIHARYVPPDEHGDINVGWLGAGHPFPRGGPLGAAVERALLLCAARPVRNFRGCHACEFCDVEICTPSLDGRDILLGNGEIRVRGGDGRWYAAPTLVWHYVTAHGYHPPAPFLEAVTERAKNVHLVLGKDLETLRKQTRDERLATCVRALTLIGASLGVDTAALFDRFHDRVAGRAPSARVESRGVLETLFGVTAIAFMPAGEMEELYTLDSALHLVEDAANDYGIELSTLIPVAEE